MTFASDKLYKGYLRRNMPTIVSKVKVREIVPHLPCLTDHDRENIEAKRETYGNFDSMVLLLDCLKRRENWPEEFITALEECNHATIAAEIRNEYNALKGDSNAGSPSATVTRAHVHPAPSAIHLPIPESGGTSDAATALPGETSAPPQQQPQPPETSALPPPQPEVAPVPSTPPPSPEAQAASRSAPPRVEATSHQEPVENSGTDDGGVMPGHPGTLDAPQPSSPVEQSETDAQSEGGDVRSTTPAAEVLPPTSPPAAPVNSSITCGSRLSVKTPQKAPVQDSNPPGLQDEEAPGLQDEEAPGLQDSKPPGLQDSNPPGLQDEEAPGLQDSNTPGLQDSNPPGLQDSNPPGLQDEEAPGPARTQDAERSSQTGDAPPPGAAATEDESEKSLCLSQPGELTSVQLPGSPTLPTPISPVEPYSGNTTRLEMSSVAGDLGPTPGSSAVTSAPLATSSVLPCQENGIVVMHNQPEENHYDSPSESLEMPEIREDLLRIYEEPSVLNLDGHDSAARGQLAHAGAAAEADPATPPPASESKQPPEPAPVESSPPALQDSEEASSRLLTSHTKYFVTAAGVGACALLLAWKFKN